MTVKKILNMGLCLIVSLMVLSPAAFGGIKDRMIKRLPVIADLKTRGVIGETNRGYLGFVGSKHEKADVINAENTDRKTVYSHFAKQQNTTLDVVEQVQGKRKAEKAKPGEYIQDSGGAWVKK